MIQLFICIKLMCHRMWLTYHQWMHEQDLQFYMKLVIHIVHGLMWHLHVCPKLSRDI